MGKKQNEPVEIDVFISMVPREHAHEWSSGRVYRMPIADAHTYIQRGCGQPASNDAAAYDLYRQEQDKK